MAKLRQFSHFLQQINKLVSHPFSKIQTRALSLFPFVRCPNLHKSKTPDQIFSGKVTLKIVGTTSIRRVVPVQFESSSSDNYCYHTIPGTSTSTGSNLLEVPGTGVPGPDTGGPDIFFFFEIFIFIKKFI